MANESYNTVNISKDDLIKQMESALKIYLQSREVAEERDFEHVISK